MKNPLLTWKPMLGNKLFFFNLNVKAEINIVGNFGLFRPKLNIWTNNSLRRTIRFPPSLCFYQQITVCSSQSRHSSRVTVCNLGQKKHRLHSPTRDEINIKTGIIIWRMLQTWILIFYFFFQRSRSFQTEQILFLDVLREKKRTYDEFESGERPAGGLGGRAHTTIWLWGPQFTAHRSGFALGEPFRCPWHHHWGWGGRPAAPPPITEVNVIPVNKRKLGRSCERFKRIVSLSLST